MNTRRSFLSVGAAAVAGAAAHPATSLFGLTSNVVPVLTPVQSAGTNVLLNHIHRMSIQPTHNPFTTLGLTTSMRFHFGDLQSNGQTLAMTNAVRAKGFTPVTATHVERALAVMTSQKIVLPVKANQFLMDVLPAISTAAVPRGNSQIKVHTMLMFQRSMHGQLAKLTVPASLRPATKTASSSRPKGIQANFLRTSFHPGLLRTAQDDGSSSSDDYNSDPGWADTSSTEAGYETGYDSGDGDYYNPDFSSQFASPFGTTYTTPSGTVVNMCQVYYGLLSLGLLGWGAALATYGDQATAGIAFLAANPELAAFLITIMGGYAAYLAFMC